MERRAADGAAVPQSALNRGVLLVAVAAIFPQVGGAFAVTVFDELGPAGAAFGRLAFAAVILVALWRPRIRDRAAGDLLVAVWRPRIRSRTPGDLLVAVLFGLALGAMNLCIYEAMDRIPLGIAVTFEFLGPLGLAVALSRKPLDLLWVALAALGVLGLADPSAGGLDAAGVAFALAAGALWAAYIVLSQRTGAIFPGGQGLAIAMVVGALFVAPLGIAGAGGDLLQPELFGVLLAVALLSSVLPYSLEIEALRTVPPRVFGVLMSIDPAIAALAGLIVLGQDLAARDWVAIGLVVIASAGASLSAARASAPAATPA